MDLFYAPHITGSVCTLSVEESIHCIKAMRFRKGDTIYLTDGKGYLYEACIIDDTPNKCSLEILSEQKQEASFPYHLHLAVSLTKNTDRYEWFVEKSVEMGIAEITALICDKTERINVKASRIERIVIAAMKQSLSCKQPLFNEKVAFQSLVEKAKEQQKFIAYCSTDKELPLLKQVAKEKTDTLILIGPEGDFTTEEVALAQQHGFIPVSLGKARLRTETAALVACNTMHIINQ